MQSQQKILIVEDNDAHWLLIRRAIAPKADMQIDHACSLTEAHDWISKNQPSLIISDLILPDGEGTSLISASHEETAAYPVVIMTSQGNEQAAVDALKKGALDYIVKTAEVLQQMPHVINRSINAWKNITERQRVEQMVKASRDFYLTLFDRFPALIWRSDVDTKRDYFNQTWLNFTGRSHEQEIDDGWIQAINPADVDHYMKTYLDAFNARQPFEIEYRLCHHSGEYRWIADVAHPFYDLDGHFSGYIGSCYDITERKQLMEQVTHANRQWEETFNAVKDMIFLTNSNGSIIQHNSVVNNYFDGKSVTGMQIDRLLLGEQASQLNLDQMNGETQLPQIDGWFDITSYPVFGAGSESERVFLIRDITGRKKIEKTLVDTHKLADLGTLAAGIAHEIKSPLQVIVMTSEARLRRIDRNAEGMERIADGFESINRNAWRIAETVRSLLSYARESDETMTEYDLNTIVKDTLLLIQHQLEVWANIKVSIELAPDLPHVLCNHNQMGQVLINLLTNAQQAMPQGGAIIIRTDFEEGWLILEVNDTGTGMTEDVQSHIFEPFFTTKPIGMGTGLGMSIVMGIIQTHGGNIQVQSAPKEGSTFKIRLPVMTYAHTENKEDTPQALY